MNVRISTRIARIQAENADQVDPLLGGIDVLRDIAGHLSGVSVYAGDTISLRRRANVTFRTTGIVQITC